MIKLTLDYCIFWSLFWHLPHRF